MPHAALWVVQLEVSDLIPVGNLFQCRTRLCGWCNQKVMKFEPLCKGFNAARSFVGGATELWLAHRSLWQVSMPHAAL
ncbi:hypothetical protein ADJ74_00555 [Selenomonas sp. oral taxon 478]|nr:hypothetical protein ADJ74_00555 [Selenomonas sp. oral taxon 478]